MTVSTAAQALGVGHILEGRGAPPRAQHPLYVAGALALDSAVVLVGRRRL